MRFDGRTLSILKNFSTINQSLLFKPGNKLRTMSPLKTVLAEATLKETIDREFAIYDVGRMLSVMSLFEQPSLKIGESHLTIADKKQKVDYVFASKNNIVTPSEKTPQIPEPEIVFKLTADVLDRIQKAMSVLKIPEMAVVGEDGIISVRAMNTKQASASVMGGDVFSIDVGTTQHTFTMVFKAENIKFLYGDYDVAISSKGIAHFQTSDVEYWVATEANSSFVGGN